ncbi:MAG: hypothetical protein HKL90_05850 [Elusimicrobia bacterium]|nr:hypothetical protein [Elusimicrobiota bacterium]
MINLLLLLTMHAAPATQTAQIQTCQWPHRCVETAVTAAPVIQTCAWPHVCANS